MKSFLALLFCLYSGLAWAQGYINAPVYATGLVNETRTGTVNTILKQAYAPGNINALAINPISSWTVSLPFPAFDGQLVTIGCPADVASLVVNSAGTDTVLPGYPSSCAASSGAASTFQFFGGTWTPISFPGSALFFPTYTNIKLLGASGNGTTSDAAAFTRAFIASSPAIYYLPPGTYRIPCGNNFVANSAASFIGAGQGVSIIKFDAGCTLTGDSFHWDGFSGVSLQNLTIDFNNPAIPQPPIPSSKQFGVAFYAYTASVTGLFVNNISVINGVDNQLLLLVAAAGGFNFQNPVITNTYMTMTPGRIDNQSIAFTTNNGAGNITGATVTGNVAIGTGLQFDGNNSTICNNNASNYQFGNGIFFAESNHDFGNLICNNTSHDTGPGIDSNNTAASGFEIGASSSVVIGNIGHDLGGGGLNNFGNHNLITGNTMWNVGGNGAAGPNGVLDQTGIALLYLPDLDPNYSSADTTVIGNKVFNAGGTLTKYGYGEEVGYVGKSTLRSNDFQGATAALNIQSPNTNSDVGYIQTQSAIASSAAFLAFTGLDTASYKSWHLECRNITPSNATQVGIQIGEGSTPTWMGTAHYIMSQTLSSAAAPVTYAPGLSSILFLGPDNWDNTQGSPGNFSADVGDLAFPNGAGGTKIFRVSAAYTKSGVGPANLSGMGEWNGDTNPITAIRVLATTGNITGSCTLSGRP